MYMVLRTTVGEEGYPCTDIVSVLVTYTVKFNTVSLGALVKFT